jgi:hypothetical protein
MAHGQQLLLRTISSTATAAVLFAKRFAVCSAGGNR